MSAPVISTPPFTLQPGRVAIYGLGNIDGINSIVPTSQTFVFGYVYSVWDGGQTFLINGSSVMFDKTKAECVIKVNNWPYTIIEEAKLILTETPSVSL